MKNIVVITDLSKHSEGAAPLALLLAESSEAKVTLLHVSEMADALHSTAPHTQTLDDYKKTVRRLARTRLEELRAELFGDRAHVRSELIDGKNVWKAICDYVTEHGVDLVVMTTHGRSGIAHAVIGSVAERVVRAAPCPVLTVRVDNAHG